MQIEIFGDGIEKEDINLENYRRGSRGIIINEKNQILVVYSPKLDVYVLPGGGIEENETEEEACIREVLEETGLKTKVNKVGAKVIEYFIDSTWENNYFVLEVIEDTKTLHLTKTELELNQKPKWIDLYKLLDIFDNYNSKNIYGQEIHMREMLGLTNSL